MIKRIKNRLAASSAQLWTFIDQCVVSGSGFVLSVILVALLGIEPFGVFSLYWMIVLLISGFHQALVVMPMYSLYASFGNLNIYLGGLLKQQLLFSLISGSAVIVGYLIVCLFDATLDPWHAIYVGAISALYTLRDLFRRMLFVLKRPKGAVWIDTIGVGILPVILLVVAPFYKFGLTDVLLLIIGLKLISCLMAFKLLRSEVEYIRDGAKIRKRHWRYGKFLLASSVLQWCSGNCFILISGVFLGPASIGVLRIAQSILGVFNVFFQYLENNVPIEAARIFHKDGKEALKGYLLQISKKYFVVMGGALLLVAIFHRFILEALFGQAMGGYEWLIPAYCVLYVLIYAGTIFRFVFRTIDQNIMLFYGYVASSIVGLLLSYPLVKYAGIAGVMTGLFLTQIASVATYSFFLKRQL